MKPGNEARGGGLEPGNEARGEGNTGSGAWQ